MTLTRKPSVLHGTAIWEGFREEAVIFKTES